MAALGQSRRFSDVWEMSGYRTSPEEPYMLRKRIRQRRTATFLPPQIFQVTSPRRLGPIRPRPPWGEGVAAMPGQSETTLHSFRVRADSADPIVIRSRSSGGSGVVRVCQLARKAMKHLALYAGYASGLEHPLVGQRLRFFRTLYQVGNSCK